MFAQLVFSRISRMALDAQKYDVSEKVNQNSTKKINFYMCENLVIRNAFYGFMRENVPARKYIPLQYYLE